MTANLSTDDVLHRCQEAPNMLSLSEEKVLETFRLFHMRPDKMLCFYGQDLESKATALASLVEKQLLVREKFAGAYSLTRAGYAQMQQSA